MELDLNIVDRSKQWITAEDHIEYNNISYKQQILEIYEEAGLKDRCHKPSRFAAVMLRCSDPGSLYKEESKKEGFNPDNLDCMDQWEIKMLRKMAF